MTIKEFIRKYQLKPADAVVLKKKFFGMVDHYAIYLGTNKYGEPIFVANYTAGVKIIERTLLVEFLQKLIPKSIDRFPLSDEMRPAAVERAVGEVGKKNYSYVTNNCEHFKNYVHYGFAFSTQAESFGEAMIVGGFLTTLGGASTKSKEVAVGGALMTVLGLITLSLQPKE